MFPDILSDRPERMSAKKGDAAARFRPKLITVSANGPQLAPSGRSDTASRLHAETVPSFPLRGRPPTERAGSCTNAGLVSCMRCRLHFRHGRFAHTGANPHKEAVRVSHLRPFPFLEYDSMVCDFPSFPKKNGKSPKEENAAPSLRPENFAGHYPPRNSLPAVAQTGAAADATGEIFSLRAPASVPTGGEAAPVLSLYRA